MQGVLVHLGVHYLLESPIGHRVSANFYQVYRRRSIHCVCKSVRVRKTGAFQFELFGLRIHRSYKLLHVEHSLLPRQIQTLPETQPRFFETRAVHYKSQILGNSVGRIIAGGQHDPIEQILQGDPIVSLEAGRSPHHAPRSRRYPYSQIWLQQTYPKESPAFRWPLWRR